MRYSEDDPVSVQEEGGGGRLESGVSGGGAVGEGERGNEEGEVFAHAERAKKSRAARSDSDLFPHDVGSKIHMGYLRREVSAAPSFVGRHWLASERRAAALRTSRDPRCRHRSDACRGRYSSEDLSVHSNRSNVARARRRSSPKISALARRRSE